MDVRRMLASAAEGDQAAWNSLVERYSGLLWSIARGYGLGTADASDAVQMTWLKLVENLESIADPARLPGWLATTARRECLQVIRRSGRTRRLVDLAAAESPPEPPPVDDDLLRSERDRALWRALGKLSERCRTLLRVLMASPPPSYAEVAAALGMRIGSIGPTRQRCLGHLRAVVLADEVLAPDDREATRDR
ncbi:RNA polymerase sigma factor [Actinokineospora soli]|uniref:RNA polymerase sigma factor n=1 Tax=Actinokineospora soli TaxID=1048753 RepID=A0ABW2TK99_9PSEU